MLETTSRWVKLEFSCLSRRWFTVASLCCLGLVFGDLTFMLFFIVRGWLPNLLISFRLRLSLYSLISLHLHSWSRLWWLSLSPYFLLQGWIVFFSMYALCAWKIVMVSSLSSDFSVVGFHSSPLMLFIFFSCVSLCRCAELVFRSFGFFYSDLCDSLLAWAPLCACLVCNVLLTS